MATDNEIIVAYANDLLEASAASDRQRLTRSLLRTVNDLRKPMCTPMGNELGELLLSIAEGLAAHPRRVDAANPLADRLRLYQELLVHGKTMGQLTPRSWWPYSEDPC